MYFGEKNVKFQVQVSELLNILLPELSKKQSTYTTLYIGTLYLCK